MFVFAFVVYSYVFFHSYYPSSPSSSSYSLRHLFRISRLRLLLSCSELVALTRLLRCRPLLLFRLRRLLCDRVCFIRMCRRLRRISSVSAYFTRSRSYSLSPYSVSRGFLRPRVCFRRSCAAYSYDACSVVFVVIVFLLLLC